MYHSTRSTKRGYCRPFTLINKAQLTAFTGINIAIEILSLLVIRNYWSTHEIMAHPLFPSVIRRDCFMEILQYLYVVDNLTAPSSTDPNYNKLWKIQPIITTLNETSARMYKPHHQLSVDESMIGTKYRLIYLFSIQICIMS